MTIITENEGPLKMEMLAIPVHRSRQTKLKPHSLSRILVCIATYNEKTNIEKLISDIHIELPTADVLVIDDNSPDGTGELVDELSKKDSRIHIFHRPRKLGLGTAILEAMRFAIREKYHYLINMDADFSHSPRYLKNLIKGMKKNDIMIGSRYIVGGGTKNWPFTRKAISKSVNIFVRLFLKIPARDCSGGFRCYSVPKLEKAKIEEVKSLGYSFHQEVLHRCYCSGAKIGETPILFENRKQGKSKVNFHEAVRSLTALVILGIKSMGRKNIV